jgi:phosphotransferase system HPr (HPr) family protein
MPASSEATVEATIALPDAVALHARPAADFVRTAMGFDARIVVTAGPREADAKSLLSVLALGATAGSTLRLRAEGPEAARAVDELVGCVGALRD